MLARRLGVRERYVKVASLFEKDPRQVIRCRSEPRVEFQDCLIMGLRLIKFFATLMNNAQHHMGLYDLGILCEGGFKFLGCLIRLARYVIDQA